jgi:DNA polymerase-3 subunit gamma/tau
LVAHFHHLAMVKLGSRASRLVDLPAHEIEKMRAQVADVPETYITQIFDLLFQAEPSIKLSAQPKLALEMIFVKLFQASPMLPIENLIERLDQLHANIKQGVGLPQSQAQIVPADPVKTDGPAEALDQSEAQGGTDQSIHTDQQQHEPVDGGMLWQQVVARIEEQRPSLAAFLKKCLFKSLENGQVTIEVLDNEFTFKNVDKNVQLLEKVFNDLSGQAVKLHILCNIEDAAVKKKTKKNGRPPETKSTESSAGHGGA